MAKKTNKDRVFWSRFTSFYDVGNKTVRSLDHLGFTPFRISHKLIKTWYVWEGVGGNVHFPNDLRRWPGTTGATTTTNREVRSDFSVVSSPPGGDTPGYLIIYHKTARQYPWRYSSVLVIILWLDLTSVGWDTGRGHYIHNVILFISVPPPQYKYHRLHINMERLYDSYSYICRSIDSLINYSITIT